MLSLLRLLSGNYLDTYRKLVVLVSFRIGEVSD